MIHYVNDNLLNSKCDYICHQVNCQGVMGSGIAKAIRDKWPIVYEEYKNWYKHWETIAYDDYGGCEDMPSPSELMLGQIQIVNIADDQSVINMASQQYYGYDGRRYTSYDAFWNCLGLIKKNIPEGSMIGFPYKIGCCRGGANWSVIETMIKEMLGKDYNVFIYKIGE
jgi:O-acetyl-ADP-ribose deacetylase (regulator of RNase III)